MEQATAIIKDMILRYTWKLILIAVFVVIMVTLLKRLEGFFERKQAKKRRLFEMKMRDHDHRTYRY